MNLQTCPAVQSQGCIPPLITKECQEGHSQAQVRRQPRNAAVLVDLSCQLLKDFLDKPFPGMPGKRYDVIIPAPLHPKRKRQRGYNQSELIAMRLARHMEIPVLKGVLVKKSTHLRRAG